jgi:hypothetical protein
MEAIATMIVPILIATVLSFLLSSLIWMVLPHHKKDWSSSIEVNLANTPEGQYTIPKDHMTSDWYGFVFVKRTKHNMGKALGSWFLNQLIISAVIGYLVYHSVEQGSPYLEVFRIAGTAALLAYGGLALEKAIWWGWRWNVAFKNLFDAGLYSLIVAGSFAFYWS